MQIEQTNTTSPREKPLSNLGFGKYFSDHMFLLDYLNGGWQNPRIVPYGPLAIEPGASVLHYAQCLFEGMKAFRGKNGKIRLFRPSFNAERMRKGAERLCMPGVSNEIFETAIEKLVKLDADWVPTTRGASLYIRPTLVGTESYLGVRPAEKYLFFVITSPVDAYYSEGFAPVKIWVEEEYIRAAPGGLGHVKAGANYACSLKASLDAKAKGYSQVLWLDAIEHKNIEEVGTMNVFFRFKDKVVTPALSGTILNGGTRDCVIQLLNEWKVPLEERSLTLAEVMSAADSGELLEVFGTGTAAVITAVGELATAKRKVSPGGGQVGELTQRLYDEITAIQYGEKPDTHGWIKEI
ncbi:MAG: branched-chain amino acid aminotransferase [Proteobacteria bacterium]|nr:MAG: branched-chain amino acid aminotransferase [Pseudomonadota bacterium]